MENKDLNRLKVVLAEKKRTNNICSQRGIYLLGHLQGQV